MKSSSPGRIRRTLNRMLRAFRGGLLGTLFLADGGIIWSGYSAAPASAGKPVLIVLTDIGGDPDDQQSMRRLMLYANEFDIRGLVASASGTPGEVEGAETRPDLIEAIIDDYAQVVENLAIHAEGYPEPRGLRAVVVSGSRERAVASLREGGSSAGSQLIERTVEESAKPVNVAIWGGARDLAQALLEVRSAKSQKELSAFIAKLRVYAIGDQDGYNAVVDGERIDKEGTGKWIKENFPQLRYVETNPPSINRYSALFRGMYQNDSLGGPYPETVLVRRRVSHLNDEVWLRENALREHGPIGANYPIVKQNPASERNRQGVKEGDTPSWFFCLPLGLGDPDEPTWGGWGGRFDRVGSSNHFRDAEDDHWANTADEATRRKWTVARWREAYQNDFAARLDWCVESRENANHPPALMVNGEAGTEAVKLSVAPGKASELRVSGIDPDGDALRYRCWFYNEVTGAREDDLGIRRRGKQAFRLRTQRWSAGQQYHLIVEATDAGSPSLTRYRRIVVDVPQSSDSM